MSSFTTQLRPLVGGLTRFVHSQARLPPGVGLGWPGRQLARSAYSQTAWFPCSSSLISHLTAALWTRFAKTGLCDSCGEERLSLTEERLSWLSKQWRDEGGDRALLGFGKSVG